MLYLKNIIIENYGPIEKLNLNLSCNQNGDPKPITLVGKNGSGKTIIQSSIADALMEFAATSFIDVLPSIGQGHKYFKISGGINTKIGSQYGFCFLNFTDGEKNFQYLDKSGKLTFNECKDKTDNLLDLNSPWTDKDNLKITTHDSEYFKSQFKTNSFCFFPTPRFESPHWLNQSNFPVKDQFSFSSNLGNYLENPILISSSLEKTKSWLMDLAIDMYAYNDTGMWGAVNEILRGIIGVSDCRLGISPRQNATRIQIGKTNSEGKWAKTLIPSLNCLSAGQIILLNIFCTILRYSDKKFLQNPLEIGGIVIVDEIDLHLHPTLKNQILPILIKKFPKIQFILSTHSPVFLLGLEDHLGNENIEIYELPKGSKLDLESFEEYKAVTQIISVKEQILNQLKENVVLFVEGKTDQTILENAWDKLFNKPRSFQIVGSFDRSFMRNLFSRGEIFSNKPNTLFIGMLDFDEAFEDWDTLRKKGWTQNNSKKENDGLLISHNNQFGHMFLLPIPECRKDYAGENFGKTSSITIELLFEDPLLDGYIDKFPLPGGGHSMRFKTKKKLAFAEKTKEFSESDFNNFLPIFKLIEEIISSKKST